VQSGWVFKVKLDPDNTVERYRSRLVAKGYSQCPGYDYTEVFAPTFRPASLPLITALAAKEGFKMRSVDFFLVQKFITRCSIAVRGRLSTTSSLHRPQGPGCPITGKRHYQYQRRNLIYEERELDIGCS